MRLCRLSLAHFRNYPRLDLDLAPGVTVLVGDNAQGKSNLLEAIFYLATTRSFRAHSDRELMTWGISDDPIAFTRIAARGERHAESFDLEIILREEARRLDGEVATPVLAKRIKLNDLVRRAVDVIGVATAVMFSPQDLELVDGAPLLRRRYLDVTISQADRAYCRSLAHYNRVILQRNHLLRLVRDRGAPADQLDFWNRELIGAGAAIVRRRLETIERLGQIAQRLYQALGAGDERLTIGYKSTAAPGLAAAPRSAEEVAQAFESRLAELQPKEIMLGMTLAGPHRDDLTFQIDGRDLSAFGSRGQQRMAALALKLAESEHLAEQIGERPIVLLDDVLSELDPGRRARVLALIPPGQQVLMTTADSSIVEAAMLGKITWLRVFRGRVEEWSPSRT